VDNITAEEAKRGQCTDLAKDAMYFRLAIENMAQGLFMLDADQRVTVLNRQVLEIYGLSPDVMKVGVTVREIIEHSVSVGNFPNLTFEQAWARAQERLAAKKPWRVQQRLGNGKVVAIAYAPMLDGGWITTHLDVTDKQKAEDRLAFLAQHDGLTGLANRSLVFDTLAGLIDTGAPFAVLCLDLDRFKRVNDNFGHAAGDDLLREVAARLRETVRETDTVARLGGDEFAIVQPLLHGPREAETLAERVILALGVPFGIAGNRIETGTSIGIATAPEDGIDSDTLLRNADTALYRAKQAGRGVFRRFLNAHPPRVTPP
jgi:diguanylate cyclase (GGDEF)-like protein/PAS domain S-box-containing protein